MEELEVLSAVLHAFCALHNFISTKLSEVDISILQMMKAKHRKLTYRAHSLQ